MKFKELEALPQEELKRKMDDLKKQLMEFEFKRKTGVEKPHQFKQARRDIARILTIFNKQAKNEKKIT